MLNGRTFLVTGATGRLGTELTRRIEELGARVTPVILGGYPDRPRRTSWPARAEPRRVESRADLWGLARPDSVINAHWEVDRQLSYAKQLSYEIERNIGRLEFFWEWLAQQEPRQLVNISSIKIYGPLNSNPITAASEPFPASSYGIAKMAAEKYFDARFLPTGTSVIHMRMCSIMAADGHPTQLTSQILMSLFNSMKIKINKGHVTHLLPLEEAADILLQAAIFDRSGRYNIVAPGILNERIAEIFMRLTGRELNAEYLDFQPGTVDPVFESDIDGFRTSWTRRSPIEDSVRAILKSDHGAAAGHP